LTYKEGFWGNFFDVGHHLFFITNEVGEGEFVPTVPVVPIFSLCLWNKNRGKKWKGNL
jgi:hypothetical protein